MNEQSAQIPNSRNAQYWLPAGANVGDRYRLDAVLGRGGYGITYFGVDTRLEQPVAVKEYYPALWATRFVAYNGAEVHCIPGNETAYQKGLARFEEEARTLAQLKRIPTVVRVTDFFAENNTAYLVMDYLDGKNLKQMAKGFGGRIPSEVLLPAMEEVVDALRKVHAKGLIHRDISPDNIMMLSDGSMSLIDFGNARDASEDRSMTLAMKEGFAAPEQYRSHGQGPWTDVYGLCASLYYCLTGKLPPQALDRLTGTPFPTPTELGVQIDPTAEAAIMDGLELFVQKRIQNMDELHERLYAQPSPVSVPEPLPVTTTTVVQQPSMPNAPYPLYRIRKILSEVFHQLKEH